MENKKIKIAQVVGNAKTGGVISCVMNFYRHIDRDKFQFDFYTYGPSPFDEEIKNLGGRVFYIPNVLRYFKSIKAMKKLFKENCYDIVHAHLTSLSFVPLKAAKKAGVKIRICHAHSTSHKSEKVWIVKNTLKHFSKIYATNLAGCSRYACNWLYGKKSGANAFVLHNAIDLTRFVRNDEKSMQLKNRYGFEGKKVVGHIGRLEFQKNPLFLIDVFNETAKLTPDVVFVMVGGGSMADKVKRKINKLGLSKKVFIFNETKHVEDYYALFDVFVLPSKFEGLPLVAIEAQMMGVPCLLSDKITRETDISGNCKFLPIKSARLWGENISESLNKNEKYNLMSIVDYNILYQVKALEDFYTELDANVKN